MASLFSAIIDDAQRTFPDMPDATALRLVQDIDNRVLQHIPLYKTTEDLTLVSGTREYEINDATVRVWHADYLESSTAQPEALRAVQIEWLNQNVSGWRNSETGTPREYYIDVQLAEVVVGFYPTPGTSTSGGYPTVRLYVSRTRTVAAGDSVPKGLRSEEVYRAGIRWLWCVETRSDQADYWRKVYDDHLNEEHRVWFERMAQAPRNVVPMVPRSAGVV